MVYWVSHTRLVLTQKFVDLSLRGLRFVWLPRFTDSVVLKLPSLLFHRRAWVLHLSPHCFEHFFIDILFERRSVVGHTPQTNDFMCCQSWSWLGMRMLVRWHCLSRSLLLSICVVLTGLLQMIYRVFDLFIHRVADLLCLGKVVVFTQKLLVVWLELVGHHHVVLLGLKRLVCVMFW